MFFTGTFGSTSCTTARMICDIACSSPCVRTSTRPGSPIGLCVSGM